MAMFHPVYGNLLTAKEVAKATGHTMNQLRNWRTDARADLAPFGSILIGATSYYREVVVQAWIDRNGRQDGKYRMTDLDREFPLNVATESDIKRNVGLEALSKITTASVYATREKFSKADKDNVNAYLRKYAVPVYAKHYPDEDERNLLVNHTITAVNRFSEPIWFAGATKAMRMYLNDRSQFGFSEAEIDAIPVGQYPPLDEVKSV